MNARTREGSGLRAVRLAFGITQAELADRTGVHRSLISRIERGLVPSWPRFRKAAATSLGVDERVLFPVEGREMRDQALVDADGHANRMTASAVEKPEAVSAEVGRDRPAPRP